MFLFTSKLSQHYYLRIVYIYVFSQLFSKEQLTQSATQGAVHPVGSDDILTSALKILEHPGRVRGARDGATFTNFFHQPRGHRSVMTNKEMTIYMNTQFQNKRQSLMEELREQVHQEYYHLTSQPRAPPYLPPHSGDDSCSISRHVTGIPPVILFIIYNLLHGILLINVYFV